VGKIHLAKQNGKVRLNSKVASNEVLTLFYSQEQMVALDINLRQLQRIESGETRNITLSNLFKIAKALKLQVTELMDV